jgi:hypothetical protein
MSALLIIGRVTLQGNVYRNVQMSLYTMQIITREDVFKNVLLT